jgi:branched-chain amino acid aminotransferase
MSTQKMSDFIWINGEFVPWEQSNIHVITHSLHYAGAVYEGLRAYNGKVFKLEEHTERLLKSAELMGLKVKYSAPEINGVTYEVLEKNNLQDAYIRPLIWRGSESIGLSAPGLTVNMLIAAIHSKKDFVNNIRLMLSPWRKASVNALPPQAKSSAHYGMAIVSQMMAKDHGYDDSLVLDSEGLVAESNVANVFFGKDNKLVTPIADRFLNGITRQVVIAMVKSMGFEVSEARIKLEDLSNYDYCFMTGTSKEISGVTEINLGTSSCFFLDPSRVVKMLQQEFAILVGK